MRCSSFILLESNKWLVHLADQGYLQSYRGFVNQDGGMFSFNQGEPVNSRIHPNIEKGIISIYDIHLKQYQIPHRGHWDEYPAFRCGQ